MRGISSWGLLGAGQQDLVGPYLGIEVPVLLVVTCLQGLLQLVVDLGPHLGVKSLK